ncbi:MAG: iron ABC transporter permease [Pseudomonadota bacterium]
MRLSVLFALLVLGLTLSAVWSLSAGAVPISWQVIANTLFDLEGPKQEFIILKSRLPRTLLAMLTGGSLALSGAIVQALLRNPLASPKIIGINSGAALGVCLMVLVLPGVSIAWLPAAAVIGGVAAALVIYLGADLRGASPVRLALVGIAVGFVFDAGVDFILVTSTDAQFSTPLIWLTGSLWARGWTHLNLVWPWLTVLAVMAMLLSYWLDLIRLGETAATGLGLRVRFARLVLLSLAVFLAALSVSVVGVLGFVGLMAPHIARSLVGGSHKVMLPCAMLVGMWLVVLADAAGRAIAPPVEVSAGVLTAMLGAPFFVYVMIRAGRATRV